MARYAWVLLLVAACIPAPDANKAREAGTGDAAAAADATHDAGRTPDDAGAAPDSGGADAEARADAGSDAGEDPADAGVAPDAAPPGPPPELSCDGSTMRDAAGGEVATYESPAVCEEVLAARGDGVVCAYFVPGDPIGTGGWDETGWRAMNWRTRVGLGRRPHESYQNCLDATRNARGGVVCTNTGVGYKSAHIETNHWCGASSAFSYCLMASVAARDFWVCSFPSEGDGSGPGWTLTHIVGSSCDYMAGGLALADCNGRIP